MLWATKPSPVVAPGVTGHKSKFQTLEFAVKVLKNNEAVSHLRCEHSRICGILSYVAKKYVCKWVAVDITANTAA